MKVLLVQPPVEDFYDTDIRLQPLGLCMLKAAVGQHLPRVEIAVRDYHRGFGRRTIPVPLELSYLREYYQHPDTSPFCSFHHFYHFGASFEEIGREVAREAPDLVGISSLFTPYHRDALACAGEIRKHLDVPILMGGPHVSADPHAVLNDPRVDYVIYGEGERPLVELLRAMGSGISLEQVPNLGFKKNDRVILNPAAENFDFIDLPSPDLTDLPLDRYLYKGRPLCFITTSRGCPHRCTFCSVHKTFGKRFRSRSPVEVLSEMKVRYSEGYRVFDFEDDNLSFHLEDFKRLLQAVIKEFPQDEIRLTAMNGISYLNLDTEALTLMKRAGFTDLNISLVSVHPSTMEKLQRPYDLAKYQEVVFHAHRLGMAVVSYQILGLPSETVEEMVSTLAFMARLPVLIGPSVFYLTPGSPIAREFPHLEEKDFLKARSTAMAIETTHFSREDLYTLFLSTRILNFLKGIRTEKERMTLPEALALASVSSKRSQTGAELLDGLLRGKKLFAATPKGERHLTHFKPDLFFRVLKETRIIQTRQGVLIDLDYGH